MGAVQRVQDCPQAACQGKAGEAGTVRAAPQPGILYDAAARYLKELKASGEEITPKEWRREIDLLAAQKQVDSIDMKAMREELKAVERLRKAADQLARQERDKSRDRGPER